MQKKFFYNLPARFPTTSLDFLLTCEPRLSRQDQKTEKMKNDLTENAII